MVLRAAEPLTTLLLALPLLPRADRPSRARVAALLCVVGGCALSASGKHGPTPTGVLIAIASNVCFSLRGILGKRVTRAYGGGPLSVFFHLCALGAAMQAALILSAVGPAGLAALVGVRGAAPLILVNGASFYAYLQAPRCARDAAAARLHPTAALVRSSRGCASGACRPSRTPSPTHSAGQRPSARRCSSRRRRSRPPTRSAC